MGQVIKQPRLDSYGTREVAVLEIGFADDGVAQVVFDQVMPEGVVMLNVYCEVITLFDGTVPVMTVGTADDVDHYQDAADITEGTAAWYTANVAANFPEHMNGLTAAQRTWGASFAATGNDSTQGRARVYFEYTYLPEQ